MSRFCSSRSYPRLPPAVSASEEREQRVPPKVSSEDHKGKAKDAIGFVNEAHKDMDALYAGK